MINQEDNCRIRIDYLVLCYDPSQTPVHKSRITQKGVTNLCQKEAHANATVTICHSRSRDVVKHCRSADIIIAAMGVPEFLKEGMISPGATIIDVGVNRIEDPSQEKGYRLVGDVDFKAVQPVAGKITPNPGGVGPMTIAMLIENTIEAAENNE